MKKILNSALLAIVLSHSLLLASETQPPDRIGIAPQLGVTLLDFSHFYAKNPVGFSTILANLTVIYPDLKVLLLPIWGEVTDEDLKNISKCTKLEELSVLSTSFTFIGIKHLRGLRELRKLELGGAFGLGHDVEIFRDLSSIENLENLTLVHPFKQIMQGEGFKFLQGLKTLDLSKCNVNNFLQYVGELHRLENLNLNRCQIIGNQIRSLTRLKNLITLNLGSTHINDDQLETLVDKRFGGLPQLRKLDLSHTQITGKSIFQLINFKELRDLNLSNSPIYNDGYLVGLTILPKLRTLSLVETNLKNHDLRYIGQIRTLEELIITLNPELTDSGLACLKNISMVHADHPRIKTMWVTDEEVNSAAMLLKVEFNRINRVPTKEESIDLIIHQTPNPYGSMEFRYNKAVAILKKLTMEE